MSELCRMVNVSNGLTKNAISVLKAKGIDTIVSSIELTNGIYDHAEAITTSGNDETNAGFRSFRYRFKEISSFIFT